MWEALPPRLVCTLILVFGHKYRIFSWGWGVRMIPLVLGWQMGVPYQPWMIYEYGALVK
jgi:hypothetical protein